MFTFHGKFRLRSRLGWLVLAGAWLIFGLAAHAQTAKDPLNNEQVEQVRDTGADPMARIKLYMKFIEGRTSEIHKIAADQRAPSPGARIHNLMEEFTRLADELQDNLETYSEDHTDMRKTLRDLVDRSAKWETSLQEPKTSQDYDFARKTAIDTAQSTTELAKKLLGSQEQYFATHKGQKKAQPSTEQ
jgi:hypothetical protein